MQRKWKERDEILALWLYYALSETQAEIIEYNPNIIAAAKLIGVPPPAVAEKLAVYAALDGNNPKKDVFGKSKQSERIFREYFYDKEKLCVAAAFIIG